MTIIKAATLGLGLRVAASGRPHNHVRLHSYAQLPTSHPLKEPLGFLALAETLSEGI